MFTLDAHPGRRFVASLATTEPRRARIYRPSYTRAFLAAEPALTTAPECRMRLAEALDELVEAGAIGFSRAFDRSEYPPLPQFVVLLDRTADRQVGVDAARYPWRPELAWAASLRLRQSEFVALQAIQAFLRDRGPGAPLVPMAERSLEVFGDEKRLDSLCHNRRLFTEGRLSLTLLRAIAYAPPFAFRHVGDGPVALVVENAAAYHSIFATLPASSPIGMIVYGGGANFAASVAYFKELIQERPDRRIGAIRYFGDLDTCGLAIPRTADVTARETGLPSVRPAVELWARLLRDGRPAVHEIVESEVADRLVSWLPRELQLSAKQVLTSGRRLAQEAVGMDSLARDRSWATWPGLGPSIADEPVPDRSDCLDPET